MLSNVKALTQRELIHFIRGHSNGNMPIEKRCRLMHCERRCSMIKAGAVYIGCGEGRIADKPI